MDDDSMNIEKNSASASKESEQFSSQKEEESAKEVKQLSHKHSDLSHGGEFSRLEESSETASEQGSIKLVHFHQTTKESESLESENVTSRSPSTIRTKRRERHIEVARVKRHKSHHSIFDRKIGDKPGISADPDTSGRTTTENILVRPSTSVVANRSYDSREPQRSSTSTNSTPRFIILCAKVSRKEQQYLNSMKKSVFPAALFTLKQDRATGMEHMSAGNICPLHSCEQIRQIERDENISQSERISDQLQMYITYRPSELDGFRLILQEQKVESILVSKDGKKIRTGQMIIGHPASFSTSLYSNIREVKVTVSSRVNEN
ncbi:unnamed protein product, partial [Larinioides sclopetarius]